MKYLISALSLTLLAGCFYVEPEPTCTPNNCSGCCDQVRSVPGGLDADRMRIRRQRL